MEVLESPADFSLESLSDVLGESRIHVAANEKKTVRIMLEGQLAEHVEAAEQPRYLKIRFHLLDEDGRVNLEKDAVFTIPAHEAL
ncbi:MAG: hypothetical protein KDK34_20045 [Leptospiraceae bacterium]|nr:hypothetical protein [Leptospiraceae bacterium]